VLDLVSTIGLLLHAARRASRPRGIVRCYCRYAPNRWTVLDLVSTIGLLLHAARRWPWSVSSRRGFTILSRSPRTSVLG